VSELRELLQAEGSDRQWVEIVRPAPGEAVDAIESTGSGPQRCLRDFGRHQLVARIYEARAVAQETVRIEELGREVLCHERRHRRWEVFVLPRQQNGAIGELRVKKKKSLVSPGESWAKISKSKTR
jgi:hypothetical protein